MEHTVIFPPRASRFTRYKGHTAAVDTMGGRKDSKGGPAGPPCKGPGYSSPAVPPGARSRGRRRRGRAVRPGARPPERSIARASTGWTGHPHAGKAVPPKRIGSHMYGRSRPAIGRTRARSPGSKSPAGRCPGIPPIGGRRRRSHPAPKTGGGRRTADPPGTGDSIAAAGAACRWPKCAA